MGVDPVVAGRTVFILDDSPLILEMARASLEAEGFRVVAVETLAELAAAQASAAPDLVLVDVNMPDVFGDDVASVLRNENGVTAPIFLFSDLEEAELAARAAQAGVDGYISKRVGIEGLGGRVRSILGADLPKGSPTG